ncbi:Hypothetical predicted protein, partial [Pelobates cultripes]
MHKIFHQKIFAGGPEEEGAVCSAVYREFHIGRTEVPIRDKLAFRSKKQHQHSSNKEADPGSLGASEEHLLDNDLM